MPFHSTSGDDWIPVTPEMTMPLGSTTVPDASTRAPLMSEASFHTTKKSSPFEATAGCCCRNPVCAIGNSRGIENRAGLRDTSSVEVVVPCPDDERGRPVGHDVRVPLVVGCRRDRKAAGIEHRPVRVDSGGFDVDVRLGRRGRPDDEKVRPVPRHGGLALDPEVGTQLNPLGVEDRAVSRDASDIDVLEGRRVVAIVAPGNEVERPVPGHGRLSLGARRRRDGETRAVEHAAGRSHSAPKTSGSDGSLSSDQRARLVEPFQATAGSLCSFKKNVTTMPFGSST